MQRLLLIALLAPFSGHAVSLDEAAPERVDRPASQAQEAPTRNCVDVEVNGERVRDYDCLSRLLAAPDNATRPPPPMAGSEAIVGRSPSALGLAHREATRQRMGNTFGTSTLPQRPPATTPTLPPAIRQPRP